MWWPSYYAGNAHSLTVTACPPDQSHEYRLTIGLFAAAKNDLSLAPLRGEQAIERSVCAY